MPVPPMIHIRLCEGAHREAPPRDLMKNMKTKVILASASPRRQELLKLIFDKFEILPADVDENISEDVPVESRPQKIAEKKALHIARSHPDCLVIGCDTAVIADEKMLGKPTDRENAVEMLKALSGKTHKVITGSCLAKGGRILSFSVTTLVEFYPLTDEEIGEYIETCEWTDKAGAYGIQGKAGFFVRGIRGDYNNVVGLPCAELNRRIKEFGKSKQDISLT